MVSYLVKYIINPGAIIACRTWTWTYFWNKSFFVKTLLCSFVVDNPFYFFTYFWNKSFFVKTLLCSFVVDNPFYFFLGIINDTYKFKRHYTQTVAKNRTSYPIWKYLLVFQKMCFIVFSMIEHLLDTYFYGYAKKKQSQLLHLRKKHYFWRKHLGALFPGKPG